MIEGNQESRSVAALVWFSVVAGAVAMVPPVVIPILELVMSFLR